jgi:hypothetical protein
MRTEVIEFVKDQSNVFNTTLEFEENNYVIDVEKTDKLPKVKINNVEVKATNNFVRTALAYDIVKNNPTRQKGDVLFDLIEKILFSQVRRLTTDKK